MLLIAKVIAPVNKVTFGVRNRAGPLLWHHHRHFLLGLMDDHVVRELHLRSHLALWIVGHHDLDLVCDASQQLQVETSTRLQPTNCSR